MTTDGAVHELTSEPVVSIHDEPTGNAGFWLYNCSNLPALGAGPKYLTVCPNGLFLKQITTLTIKAFMVPSDPVYVQI